MNNKPISSDLSILYFNARSVLPKLAINELKLTCTTESPDVVCIVEMWLGNSIHDSELVIEGYNILRLDRNRHGGGIMLYTKSY